MRKYSRVIPRDLFNEAKLLKCLGMLYLKTEGRSGCEMRYDGEASGTPFIVGQSQSDGSLYCDNVSFEFNGDEYRLFCPLNSRGVNPLRFVFDELDYPVFDDSGNLSEDFEEFFGENVGA